MTTKTYRTRRAIDVPGVGSIPRGATCDLTEQQYQADKNSLVKVPAPSAANSPPKSGGGPPDKNTDRMDTKHVTR